MADKLQRNKKLLGAVFLALILSLAITTPVTAAPPEDRYEDQRFVEVGESIKKNERAIARYQTYLKNKPDASNANYIRQLITDLENKNKALSGEEASLRQSTARRYEAYEENAGECSWTKNWDNCLYKLVANLGSLTASITSKLMSLTNELLNLSINISVNKFSTFANSPGIVAGWTVLRDMANIGFIFILLYAGIGMMLQLVGDAKKLVVNVIIVALLINFSAVFTRVIIDVSNVLANQIYTQAGAKYKTASGAPDITKVLVESVNPARYVATAKKSNIEQTIISTFGSTILYLITSFVFLAAALMFIVRTIRLLILIVLSPIAFFFYILPGTKKHTDKWWGTLIADSFFAPAFLLMMLISIQMVAAGKVLLQGEGEQLIFFALVIGMMLASIIVAKSFGSSAATTGLKWAKKAMGKSTGALMGGGAGYIARHTIGRGANALAESEGMAKLAARGGMAGWMGRLAMRGGSAVAKSSFDIRASKTAKAVGLTKSLGGKAQKGGYAGTLEAETKREKAVLAKIEGKLGKEAADQYAATLLERPGAGQRAKTVGGIATGAAIGTAIMPGLGTLAGATGGAIIGGIWRWKRNAKANATRKAAEYARKADEAKLAGDTKTAEAYQSKADRQKQKAEKLPLRKPTAPIHYQELHEDRTGMKEKALTAEITEMEGKTREEFVAGRDGNEVRTLNEDIGGMERQIRTTESHARQSGQDMSNEVENLNKIRENKRQQLKSAQNTLSTKLEEKLKEVAKNQKLAREKLQRGKGDRAKRDEETKMKKKLQDVIDEISKGKEPEVKSEKKSGEEEK